MPTSGAFEALGAMASQFGQYAQQQKEQKHQEELDQLKLVAGLVTEGVRSGRVEPQAAMSWMLQQFGGGKGTGRAKSGASRASGAGGTSGTSGAPHPILSAIIGGILHHAPKAEVQGPGLAPPQASDQAGGMPPWKTTQQVEAEATESEIARSKALTRAGYEERVREAREQLGLTGREAAEFALTGKIPVTHIGVPGPVGGPVPSEQLQQSDPDAKDMQGNPLPFVPGTFYQPVKVQGPDGWEIRYTPGKPPVTAYRAQGAADLTGTMKELVEAELGKIPVTLTKASQEQFDRAYQAASAEYLAQRRRQAQATQVRIDTGQGNPDDIDDQARDLLSGNLLPSMLSKRAATYGKTLARARRLSLDLTGKPFNFAQAELQYRAAQRFASTLAGNPNIVNFKVLGISVVNTIDEVKNLAGEMRQGAVQIYNRAKRGTALQLFGNTPYSETAAQYVTAINTLREEFARLAVGGYAPTESAWDLANSQINGDYSLRDLTASLDEVQRLINYRLQAFDQLAPPGWVQPGAGGTGGTGGPAVDPDYQDYLKRRGGR
jgi:hypothetical protein